MKRSIGKPLLLGALIGASALAMGCQEIEQPTTVLTSEQWKKVKKHILSEEPKPKHKIGAVFEDQIELIGFDVDKPLEAGKETTFTWYWRAKKDIKQNWKVFVHLDAKGKAHRQNLDHNPVRGLYPTGRWKKGQIIEDIHKVTLGKKYPGGQAIPYIGLFRGNQRMKISNDVRKTKEPQPRVIGPELQVKGPKGAARKAKKPMMNYAARIMKKDEAQISVDGKLEEEVWKKLPAAKLFPYAGNPKGYLSWAKMFRDEEHLYIAAYMQDSHVWGTFDKRDSKTWTEEVFEFFLDVDGDGKDYLELQVTPKNTVFDARFAQQPSGSEDVREKLTDKAASWNLDGLQTAVHVDGTLNKKDDKDRAWSVEIKLPIKNLPGVKSIPKSGETWKANFYRFDRPDEKRKLAFIWDKRVGGNFHNAAGFGTLRFTDAAPPTNRRRRIDPSLLKNLRGKEGMPNTGAIQKIDPKLGMPEKAELPKGAPPLKKPGSKAAKKAAEAKSK